MASLVKDTLGTSLVIQWLRLCAFPAGGWRSVPGWGTKILHAMLPKKRINQMYLFSYCCNQVFYLSNLVPI